MPQPQLLFTLCLIFLLIAQACFSHRRLRRQEAELSRLNEALTCTTRDHLIVRANMVRTQRDVQALVERLDALECRSTGGGRIDSAMRVARQGAANPALLKELGLSYAEASLLMRLHSMQNKAPQETCNELPLTAPSKSVPGQAASLASLLAGANAA